jgi:hypothetical protein
MPLLDALPFLKGAVRRSLPGGAPSTYIFHGGAMYAQNAAILSRYPMPHILGDFALAADDLEHTLARMPTEPEIGAGDGTLILKAGRLRSSITLMACEPPHGDPSGINDWSDPPAKFLASLRLVEPFVPDEGSWQRGAKLEDGRIIAISNHSAVDIKLDGLVVGDVQVVLTDDCVRYLAKLDEEPSKIHFDGSSMWAIWPSGAWVRCQLSALDWPPDIFDRIVGGAGEATPIELTQEWREAFGDIVALGDGSLTVRPGAVHGRTEHADHDAEFATGVGIETRWSTVILKPMFGCGATAWNPDADGPAAFAGPGLRGVVMRRR